MVSNIEVIGSKTQGMEFGRDCEAHLGVKDGSQDPFKKGKHSPEPIVPHRITTSPWK